MGEGKKERSIEGELPEHFSRPLVSKSCFSLSRSLSFHFAIKRFLVLLLSSLLSFNSLRDRGKTDPPQLLGGITFWEPSLGITIRSLNFKESQ
jgi:hypothetical protein